MDRLLIIACSQRKTPLKRPVPAIDRYDGPAFRVLRRYLRADNAIVPTVLILSAKYGLIAADRKIRDYDRRLSRAVARELQPHVLEAARDVLGAKIWHAVGICAGRDYQLALEGLAGLIPEGVRVDVIRGGQGSRLAALRNWLIQLG